DGIRDFHVTGVQTCALPISCDWVGELRKIVTEEWNSRRLGSWVDPDASFDETMLSTPTNESYDKEWFVLNNIINWYAWLDRNNRSEERRVGKECGSRSARAA